MRTLDCAICEKEVHIRDRDRFQRLVMAGEKPLCRQCRRYARERSGGDGNAGTARLIETTEETEVTVMGLLAKGDGNHQRDGPLASRRLSRVVAENLYQAGETAD